MEHLQFYKSPQIGQFYMINELGNQWLSVTFKNGYMWVVLDFNIALQYMIWNLSVVFFLMSTPAHVYI